MKLPTLWSYLGFIRTQPEIRRREQCPQNTRRFVAYYRVSTDQARRTWSRHRGAEGSRPEVPARREWRAGGRGLSRWSLVGRTTARSGPGAGHPRRPTAPPSIIAKLDRLARNDHFVSGLMEAGVEFVAVDFPGQIRLTIHILSAVAEHETGLISARTKAALAVRWKARESSWARDNLSASSPTPARRTRPASKPAQGRGAAEGGTDDAGDLTRFAARRRHLVAGHRGRTSTARASRRPSEAAAGTAPCRSFISCATHPRLSAQEVAA